MSVLPAIPDSGQIGQEQFADFARAWVQLYVDRGSVVDEHAARIARVEALVTAGGCTIDSFPGATADDRLDAALAWSAESDLSPAVFVPGRNRLTRRPKLFRGATILGLPGAPVEQPRAGDPYAAKIEWRPAAERDLPLFFADNVKQEAVKIGNVAIDGSGVAEAAIFGNRGAGSWQTCVFRDIGIANVRDAIGNPSKQMALTGCTFDGFWNANNYTRSGWTIGGSDSKLWVSGQMLLDSPTTMMKGACHAKAAWLSKSTVGFYDTTEGSVPGLVVDGDETSYELVVLCSTVEGRNAGKPNTGPVVVHQGGEALYLGCGFGFGSSKSAAGLVRVTGGRPTFLAPAVHRGAMPETTPFIAVDPSVPARDVQVSMVRRSGSWAGLPVVKGPATCDGTVTQVA